MKRIFLILLIAFNYSFSQCEIGFMDLITASKFINDQSFDILESVAKRNKFNYDSNQDKYICSHFKEIKLSKLTADRTYIKYEFQNRGELNNNLDLFKTYGVFHKTENSKNSKTDIYVVLKNYLVYVNTATNKDANSKDFLKENYTILITYQE